MRRSSSDPEPPSTRRSTLAYDLGALLALMLVVLAFFAPLAFSNRILGRGDAFLYFTPYWAYRDAALRAGRLPLWNPVLFMGAPFLANSQAGVFYPPNWVFAALPALDPPSAIKWSLIGHAALAAVLAFGCARRTLGLGRPAAWLAGLLFGLGGYLGAQVEHVNQVQALAWLPALFALVAASANPGRSWGTTGATAAVIALMVLAGHTQSAFIALGGAGVFALWLSLAAPLARVRQSAGFLEQPAQTAVLLDFAGDDVGADAEAGSAPAAVRESDAAQRGSNPRAALAAAGQALRRLVAHATLADLRPLAGLALAAGFAVVLTAAQLLPTLELSGRSLRSAGLDEQEAVSFSLAPPLLGRALLPAYDGVGAIFNEYYAAFGTAALVLTTYGLWAGRREPRVVGLALVAVLGLFFALGGFNPVYRLLVRVVPGFDLFRAPARWLVLWACAGALLAAYGLEAVLRGQLRPRAALAGALLGLAAVAGLVGLSAAATTGVRGELVLHLPALAAPPAAATAGWIGAALGAGLLGLFAARVPRLRRVAGLALLGLVAADLYAGSWPLPYRHPTAPQAWTSVRPAMAHLLAAQASEPVPPLAASRFLALSAAEFDPGDVGELWSAYGPSWPSDCGGGPPGRPDLLATVNLENPLLAPDAVCQLLIATKHKEMLSPNLPLGWNLPAADGYDGGVLPLRDYAAFATLVGAETRDGRLRENVQKVPDGRVLALMNVRWLITDKVGDVPIDGVFYDLRHGATLGAGGVPTVTVATLPDFEATELRVVATLDNASGAATDTPVLGALLTFADGSAQWLEARAGEIGPGRAATLAWGGPRQVRALVFASRLAPGAGTITVAGATLVDARTGAFDMLVVSGRGRYRLAHSADVKVYENLDVLPRAFVVREAIVVSDEAALNGMRAVGWQPGNTVFLAGGPGATPLSGPPLTASVVVRTYEPERVIVDVTSSAPGYLVISDAWYPGWRATLDGVVVPIVRADVLFRAVGLPAGTHRVRLTFEPEAWPSGVALSLLGWLGLAAGAVVWGMRPRYPI